MGYNLDVKDKKILFELDYNARQSFSEIGKKVGLGKQVVAYRINQMLKAGVIQKFLTIIDTAKLGYTNHKIFLRLQNINRQKEKEIIGYLLNHPYVQWYASADGNYDMLFNLLAKDSLQLDGHLNELDKRFGQYIAEREVTIMLYAQFFYRDYLIDKYPKDVSRKKIFFGSVPAQIDIDEINRKILKNLANYSRTPTVEIAKQCGVSADAVASRIKKLENAGIIQNYMLVLDNAVLGQMHYKVVLSLNSLSMGRANALDGFCNLHPNVYFTNRLIGPWQFEINLEVKDANEFRDFMLQLKENFSDIIRSYLVFSLYKVHKFDFYPMKL